MAPNNLLLREIPLKVTQLADGRYVLSVAVDDGSGGVGLPAGENHIGAVGGGTALITPTVTVTSGSAYASGNILGGKLTLTNAMRVSGGSGVWQGLFLQDAANQKPALDILLFDSDPSNGTYTDKTAFTYNASDRPKCIRKFSVAASDWTTIQGGSAVAVADLAPGGKPVVASGSRNLYALLVLNGSTPTFAAATDLVVRFGFLQD